jgi:arginyl-tRNA synthetase
MLVCTSCSAVYQAPTLLRKPQTATRLRRCVASVAAPPQSAAATTTLDVKAWLAERVGEALGEAFGAEYAGADPLITPATKPEFGDYQCNVAMGLGKRLKSKPRDVASSIVAALKVDECFEPTEIAGPGFLNLRLKPDFITAQLKLMLADADARLAIPPAPQVGRVVVDYSSPNIAKEMHVGHLRSTIIGDTLARVLELRGHDVLRLNHVGDWGTQFGMLITQLRAEAPAAVSGEQRLDISELVALYKRAKAAFDESDDFKKTSREEVVKLQVTGAIRRAIRRAILRHSLTPPTIPPLQAGDAESVKAWRALCEQSEVAFQKVYDTLRVDERLETRGESFYNNKLGETVEALKEGSLLKESDGAQVVYAEDGSGAPIATNRDGDPMPMIVQKSDGGYMYSTTDLAAVRQRVTDEAAARVLYVTDAGQAQHFEQVFAISRKAGFAPDGVSLEHVPFGLVLGEDGKKFKTRSGETVKLVDLLDEALSRAKADVSARLEAEGREADAADPEFVDRVSRAVGIGAVKYADLSMNRMSNYKFSYDKMLALRCAAANNPRDKPSPALRRTHLTSSALPAAAATRRRTCSTRTRASAASSAKPPRRRAPTPPRRRRPTTFGSKPRPSTPWRGTSCGCPPSSPRSRASCCRRSCASTSSSSPAASTSSTKRFPSSTPRPRRRGARASRSARSPPPPSASTSSSSGSSRSSDCRG